MLIKTDTILINWTKVLKESVCNEQCENRKKIAKQFDFSMQGFEF